MHKLVKSNFVFYMYQLDKSIEKGMIAMLAYKNSGDRNASLYNYFIQKDYEAYKKMYKLIQLIVKAKTVAKFATNTELVPKDESVLIVPTLTYSKNSLRHFSGDLQASISTRNI